MREAEAGRTGVQVQASLSDVLSQKGRKGRERKGREVGR